MGSILEGMRLILGSQSARRKEILSFFDVPFTQVPSAFDEESVPFQNDPVAYANKLSVGKAKELATRFPADIILTADTIVFFNGTVYNKPKHESQAFAMLKSLAGHWHQVFTSVTVLKEGHLWTEVAETKILFHPLTDEQIQRYLQSCHYTDRAGSYAIQQAGGILVARIEGCYYNVMGLPITAAKNLLLKAGIDLWKHLKSF